MQVCGHRGAAGLAPENTIASLQAALQHGVQYVECDVHATRDGQVAVIHDSTLERTTNGKGRVAAQDWAALQQLDAGQGERIPHFAEWLEALKGRAQVVCEFKATAAVAPAIQLVCDLGMIEETTFISFHWKHLEMLKQLEPRAKFAALLWDCNNRLLEEALALGGGIDMHYERVCLKVSKRVHEAGRFLWVYTPNTWRDHQLMMDLGVDVVTTDRPDVALAGLGSPQGQR